ncbi:MAG TPA: lipopolysaccharide assembly protein LapA domain-containing protein [Acidimicrobiales bacterium]|nr:lipopolysaccharide assembly protein LapA domain-containing protein [Acidimicrobiales bacterium]
MGTRANNGSVVEETAPSTGTESPTTIHSTRAGRTWIGVLPALVLLAVTVVFVLQNLRSAKVTFITASGRLPLGLALLIAAALGALVVLALGSIRIVQLRHLVHRASRKRRGNDM